MCLLIIAISLLLSVPAGIAAHAMMERSAPLQGAELAESPDDIRIQFTEAFNPKLSQIRVEDDQGRVIDGQLRTAKDRWLIYKIPKLPNGVYKVTWQTLSVDTHVSEGSFRFSVAVPLAKDRPNETVSLDAEPGGSASASAPIPSMPASQAESGAAENPHAAHAVGSSGLLAAPFASPPPEGSHAAQNHAARGSEAPKEQAETPSAAAEAAGAAAESAAATMATPPGASAAETALASPPPLTSVGMPSAVTPAEPAAEAPSTGAPAAESAAVGAPAEPDTVAPPAEPSATAPSLAAPPLNAATEEATATSGAAPIYRLLRIAEVLAASIVAGFLFFRYGVWGMARTEAPPLFGLRCERLLLAGAAILFIATGGLRLWTLADQLGAFGTATAIERIRTLVGSTTIGWAALLHPLLAAATLALTFVPKRIQREAAIGKLTAAIGGIALFPLTGHAYSASPSEAWIAVLSHTLHMALAAAWLGGLAGLFAATMNKAHTPEQWRELNRLIRRFSAFALPALIAIVLAGALLSLQRIPDWPALFLSEYGRLILAKIGILAVVVFIAAFHRWVWMPQIAAAAGETTACGETTADGARSLHRLAIGVRLEIVLAAALFVLAGMLSTTAPP